MPRNPAKDPKKGRIKSKAEKPVPDRMPGTAGITAEEAERMLAEDAALSIKGATDAGGKLVKRLSPSVRRMLQEKVGATSGKDWANNISELAGKLGITRPTVYAYKRRPGRPADRANGKYYVPEWAAFIASQRERETEGATTAEKFKSPKHRLDAAKAAKAEHELGILQRQYVDREEVNRHIADANAIVARELSKKFTHELPPQLEGLKASEIQIMLNEALVEALSNLPKAISGPPK